MFNSRESSWGLISLFLVVQAFLIAGLVNYSRQIFVPIARQTHWILHPDLLFAAVLFLIVIVGIVFFLGRLKPGDVGLRAEHIPVGILVTACIWLITQLALVVLAYWDAGTVEMHPDWDNPGVKASLGFFVAMLIGMALYEEVAFRGFLFPQLYLKFSGSYGKRVLMAAVASSFLFALVHIPTRILNAGLSADALFIQIIILTVAGLIGVILYVRTQNLFVVIGIHALVNAPLPMVQPTVSPFVFTAVLSGILWVLWPALKINPPAKNG
jgi:membrane protease YdiL (CAAX protease family)